MRYQFLYFLFSVFTIVALFGHSPSYAKEILRENKKENKEKSDVITLYTGPKTGTYYAFGRDIAESLQKDNLIINVKPSEGSVDNIKKLSVDSGDGLAIGISQSDVLSFLARSNNASSRQIAEKLKVIAPLYHEEIHVLAKNNIRAFKDLQGRKVAVGEEGSGHMLTAVNLFALEQIVPSEINKIAPEKGVVAVLEGNIDAVVLVGGKPMKLFKNIEDLTKPENQKFSLLLRDVHFIPLNSTNFYNEYEPAELTEHDYNFIKTTIPTITVPALLVSYYPPYPTKNYKEDKNNAEQKRCKLLQKFTSKLSTNLSALQQNAHPKWREVNLTEKITGWKYDQCLVDKLK